METYDRSDCKPQKDMQNFHIDFAQSEYFNET